MGNTERKQHPPVRVIKRYSNRKLYDTTESIYVTLLDISALVRSGEQVKVVDNATKEDKTDVTLALVLSEELKAKPGAVPLPVLEALVRGGGPKTMERDEETRSKDAEASDPGSQGAASEEIRATLDQCRELLDERVQALLPRWEAVQAQEQRLQELSQRVAALEQRLGPGAKEDSVAKNGGRE